MNHISLVAELLRTDDELLKKVLDENNLIINHKRIEAIGFN